MEGCKQNLIHPGRTSTALDGEKEVCQHYKFMEPVDENYEKFRNDIAEKERRDIYQYAIVAVGDHGKPMDMNDE